MRGSVLEQHSTNITLRQKSMMYKCIAEARQQLVDIKDYELIPSFLRELVIRNVESRATLQLDDKRRIYRVFVSLGSVSAKQDYLIPVMGIDGAHSKNRYYNGTNVLLVGADGNSQNVPMAIAFIPKETTSHFTWVFMQCL